MMKFKLAKGLFSLSVFLWQWPVIAATVMESKEDSYPGVSKVADMRRMGVEIETSSIKIGATDDDKVGFTISNRDGRPYLVLEEDTLDSTFRTSPSLSLQSQNLECRTVGGLIKPHLLVGTHHIQALLQNLYVVGVDATFHVTPEWLNDILKDEFVITSHSALHHFVIKTKEGPSIIRPQLTYQLPLEEMERAFTRLQRLNHKGVMNFLNILDPDSHLSIIDISAFRSKLKADVNEAVLLNMLRQQEIKRFFKENISPLFHSIEDRKLKGFCLLFFYYWFELFNNKEGINENEPGVKQFLGVMSRLPFSQLYESLIVDGGQAKLNDILRPLIDATGDQYRLRAYVDYDEHPYSLGLTIREWYLSIVDDGHRQEAKGRMVDRLSPPHGLPADFESMGALDITSDAQGLSLIEVRGYASLTFEERYLTIMGIRGFVQREADWFFDQ